MQNLVVVSHTVRSHAAGHKNWGPLGSLGWERGWPLKIRYSPQLLSHQIWSLVNVVWALITLSTWIVLS